MTAEQALQEELHGDCEHALQLQAVTTMAHYSQRPLSRGNEQSCIWLASSFCLMASEADFGLGSGFNVAFRSALWWAIWHPPLHLCCSHWQGWMKHGFYCYSIGQLPATFSEAKQICEENKAYLATVTDRYGNVILVLSIVQPSQKVISSHFAVINSVQCFTTPSVENIK